MKTRYFKNNESFFKFVRKMKDKINIVLVEILPNSIKVKYDLLTQNK